MLLPKRRIDEVQAVIPTEENSPTTSHETPAATAQYPCIDSRVEGEGWCWWWKRKPHVSPATCSRRVQAHLDRDAEQRPAFLGEASGDETADAQAAGEGHEGVERRKEVGDFEWGPVESIIEVVVARSEDVE